MNFKNISKNILTVSAVALLASACSQNSSTTKVTTKSPEKKAATESKKAEPAKKSGDTVVTSTTPVTYPPIDHAQYDALMKKMANGDSTKWPVKNAPYPLPGAILPYKRVVAFYGNLSSKGMGILGELPPNEMLPKLKGEVKNWKKLTLLRLYNPRYITFA